MQQQQNTYKYVLYPGNNHFIIQQALSNRKLWKIISHQQYRSAHLIWKRLNFHKSLYDEVDEILKNQRNHFLLNHFQHNYLITNKSYLVKSLKYYYSHSQYSSSNHVFQTIPTTFIIQSHKQTLELKDFNQRFYQIQGHNLTKQKMPQKHCKHNIWFIKPENQNQGRGIILTNNIKQIKTFINSKPINTSWYKDQLFRVIQKAIQKPLLYQNRKFDVRVWILLTHKFDIYFYKVPYMRTSSKTYDVMNFISEIHLTNNYQQKMKTDYSKYQQGNTIPLSHLKICLQSQQQYKNQAQQILTQILERMKKIAIDVFLSAKKSLFKNVRKKQFELFGFDFLIDQDFRTWLLQVNNNPYLGTPNQFIKDLVPKMVNQMFQIVLDPIFPPSISYKPVENKFFQVIYHQIPIFRVMNLRRSFEERKKSLYPINISIKKQYYKNKLRRNSQGLNEIKSSLFINQSKWSPTPIETIKNLLTNYYFNDYDPFFMPVHLLLTSNKIKQQLNEINIKNLQLITRTRIAGILLESKFIEISKNIIISDQYNQSIKAEIIHGFINGIKNKSNKIGIMKVIIPAISYTIIEYIDKKQVLQQIFIDAIIKLLIKIGGRIDRKNFIPGQTRQLQSLREYFIQSNCIGMLMFLKQKYPQISAFEVKQFLSNFNSKDWQSYQLIKSKQIKPINNIKKQLKISVQALQQIKYDTQYRKSLDFPFKRSHLLNFPKIRK